MIDEKIARVKKLIEQREKIDAELATLFGVSEPSRRGRPRKEQEIVAPSEPNLPDSTAPSTDVLPLVVK